MTKKIPAAGHIRIIAGQWRRHQLTVLTHDGLRPSSDRVRETVFNWLNHLWGGQFADKKVIDAFAGTGAFGLECISRGARAVTLIDAHAPAITAINQTLAHWCQQDASVAQVQAITGDALHQLTQLTQSAQAGQTFDLVFLDPPFGQGWLDKTLSLVAPLCHADTLLYVEVEKKADVTALSTQGWTCLREGTTAQVAYSLWRRVEKEPVPI